MYPRDFPKRLLKGSDVNELSIFSYQGREVRTVMREGSPWWVAKDVADLLGYVWQGAKSVRHVPEEWRGVYSVYTPSGDQEMVCFSREGLFFFLARSDKPLALPFQKWVAGEVLPSIERTGSYTSVPALSEVDKLAIVLGVKLPEITRQIGAVVAAVEVQSERLAQVEERQRVTDPREIEKRMAVLHDIRDRLVQGTRDQMIPINHPAYWRALKTRFNVGSFQHRAALTVPLMDDVIEFARGWALARGVTVQPLFQTAPEPQPVS